MKFKIVKKYDPVFGYNRYHVRSKEFGFPWFEHNYFLSFEEAEERLVNIYVEKLKKEELIKKEKKEKNVFYKDF
jgi:hypothetical protein